MLPLNTEKELGLGAPFEPYHRYSAFTKFTTKNYYYPDSDAGFQVYNHEKMASCPHQSHGIGENTET